MKKTLTTIAFVFIFLNIMAQKAEVKNFKIKYPIERPQFLKKIKTFSYEIQDDGKFWNYIPGEDEKYPAENYPNITSFVTDDLKAEGLSYSEDNTSDLKIIAGFIGNQPTVYNGLISMNGTASIFFLVDGNKILRKKIEDIKPSNLVSNKYPMKTRTDRIKTKANLLSILVQNELNNINFLFNDTPEIVLPFGKFKKVKKGPAVSFNAKSDSYIQKIVKDPTNLQLLEEAEKYWLSQIKIDFGKKLKAKHKKKVIYANLTSVEILKGNLKQAKEYYKIIKENTGFFDAWTVACKKAFKIFETLKNLKDLKELPEIKYQDDVVYNITIDEPGLYTRNKKEVRFSKIRIQRFVPNIKSNIASLNSKIKPTIEIYEDGVKTLTYFGDDKVKIKTDSGKEIIFKEDKNVLKPYVKTQKGFVPLQ